MYLTRKQAEILIEIILSLVLGALIIAVIFTSISSLINHFNLDLTVYLNNLFHK